MMRSVISHALAVYIGAGLFAGFILQVSIPAINALGIGYISITWPMQIYCAPAARQCGAPPAWACTLGDEND